ncbi:MAG: SRPBCC family protein [Mycobacteriaceae bacterium]|nr:SRPBCC family protein [Mycobacteriaceae bacterium]
MSWWIGSTEHTLTELIPAAPQEVRQFYVDLDNIRLVHPLVISVRALARTDTAGGYVQTYRVSDRITLGLWTLTISYAARLQVPAAGDVVAEARQFPRVRLHSVVAFEDVPGGTRLVEHVRIEAPRPLTVLTTRQAVKAHIDMLAGIRRHFE